MAGYGSLYCRLLAVGLLAIVCGLAVAEPPRRAPHPLDGLSFQFAKTWREKARDYPEISTQHPTLGEFQEEVRRADVLVRGHIARIVSLADPQAIQLAEVRIDQHFHGQLIDRTPIVQMHIPPFVRPDDPQQTLPDVGDEVILLIQRVRTLPGNQAPAGQRAGYFCTSYYRVDRAAGIVRGHVTFPPSLQAYEPIERFEGLIRHELDRPLPRTPLYQLGRVLLQEDFDDGSLAGWTFLQGEAEPLPGGMEKWMSPSRAFMTAGPPGGQPVIGKPSRDPETGIYYKIDKGSAPDQRATWFGVVDGKLRLQTSSIQQHLTVVGGDPQWTDYQVDVDLTNRASRIRDEPVNWWNYLKFGLYGRVHVPQFPETRGGHSFVATEIGDYANEGYTASDHALQIRVKYPEPPILNRDHSHWLRTTKILDYDAWRVPHQQTFHLTARYFGNHVELWIEGQKILSGIIPADHPGVRQGRIGLWTFETWCDFDNIQVTQLVPVTADSTDR